MIKKQRMIIWEKLPPKKVVLLHVDHLQSLTTFNVVALGGQIQPAWRRSLSLFECNKKRECFTSLEIIIMITIIIIIIIIILILIIIIIICLISWLIIGSDRLLWTYYTISNRIQQWTEQVKNPKWQEADQLPLYKFSRVVEPVCQCGTWTREIRRSNH